MAFSGQDGKLFSNLGTGATNAFSLNGGTYAIVWSATVGGGNLQLQTLANDGSTWVAAGSSITAVGLTTQALPPGQYRFNITTSTANYISIARVPA